jgi:hypothetical protein
MISSPALMRRTLAYRWVCLGLLFASGALAFFTRLAPAVAIPDLQAAFGLNAAAIGLLTSLYLWHREFGTLTGAWASVANLGGVTAAGPLMALITLAGWRLSLRGVGVIMLATALLIYLLVRDRPAEPGLPSLAEIDGRPGPTPGARPSMSLGQAVAVVLCEPNTWFLGGYAFLLIGTMTMMQGLWAAPYLLGASRRPAGRTADRRAVGGDALGRFLRLDLDPVVGAAEGLGPVGGRRDRHGDPQPVLLAGRRRLPAGQRIDPGPVLQAGRVHAGRRLSGGVLAVPRVGGAQRDPRRREPGAPARRRVAADRPRSPPPRYFVKV